jgi:hypothetical protein
VLENVALVRSHPRIVEAATNGRAHARPRLLRMSDRRTDLDREIVRPAVAAAVVAFVQPLLPVYGSGSEFFFSLGYGLPALVSFLLGWWTNVVLVALGILLLKRDRVEAAGGLFLAGVVVMAILVTRQVIETAPHFGRWQTDLFLILEIIEGVLLALATRRAIGVPSS